MQSQKPLSSKSKVSTSASWTGSSVKADHRYSQSSQQDDEKNGAIFACALIQQLEQTQSKAQKQQLLTGHIARLACTQNGSRYLQKELARADPTFIEFVLQEMGPTLQDIMVDCYGNYFCQKLLQCCTIKQRSQVLVLIKKNFNAISCDSRGTHTVQTILENVELALYEEFIRDTLAGQVVRLSKDQQGTHVI